MSAQKNRAQLYAKIQASAGSAATLAVADAIMAIDFAVELSGSDIERTVRSAVGRGVASEPGETGRKVTATVAARAMGTDGDETTINAYPLFAACALTFGNSAGAGPIVMTPSGIATPTLPVTVAEVVPNGNTRQSADVVGALTSISGAIGETVNFDFELYGLYTAATTTASLTAPDPAGGVGGPLLSYGATITADDGSSYTLGCISAFNLATMISAHERPSINSTDGRCIGYSIDDGAAKLTINTTEQLVSAFSSEAKWRAGTDFDVTITWGTHILRCRTARLQKPTMTDADGITGADYVFAAVAPPDGATAPWEFTWKNA